MTEEKISVEMKFRKKNAITTISLPPQVDGGLTCFLPPRCNCYKITSIDIVCERRRLRMNHFCIWPCHDTRRIYYNWPLHTNRSKTFTHIFKGIRCQSHPLTAIWHVLDTLKPGLSCLYVNYLEELFHLDPTITRLGLETVLVLVCPYNYCTDNKYKGQISSTYLHQGVCSNRFSILFWPKTHPLTTFHGRILLLPLCFHFTI